ncbi:hypothetical protein N2W54_000508 [Lotmaria passim]
MYATKPFLTALYNDVKERLPLWSTTCLELEGGRTTVVTSTWVDQNNKSHRRVFFGVEATVTAEVTPQMVEGWVKDMRCAYSMQVTGELVCYLCFIDCAGSVAYYMCETAAAES